MKRIFCAFLCLTLMLPLIACGQKTQTIEITADNWDTYFEFRTLYCWSENAFGETDMVEYPTALCVKEAYIDRIVMDEVNLAVECAWVQHYRETTVDWENRTITFGEDTEATDTHTTTASVTEIHSWESYENAYIVVYLRDVGFNKDTLGEFSSHLSMEDCEVVRIQGTITIKE